MKIKEILNNKTNYENEKKLALMQVLNLSKPEIILNKEKELTKKQQKQYQKIEKKLKKGEPIQYILKEAYFYNEKFYVNKNVLIPRPETETLVETTTKLIKEIFNNEEINILDIGTGSGIISIMLRKLNKKTDITATDISKKALKVAKKNNKLHQTNVKYKRTNLYKGINEKFDVVISNPPYIDKKSKDIEEKVKENEPHLALFAKEEGIYFYKEIMKNIKNIINENHIIAFEIGENQGEKIKQIIKKEFPQDEIIIKKDYNNHDRYIFSYKK